MSYTIPEPHKVRALRIPADGSDPHLITLETLLTEPTTYPQSTTYDSLLSHLIKEEKTRHVPNVMVFWGATGWERRSYTWAFYENEASLQSLEGKYFVFLAVDPERLPPNKHLSNHLLESFGDAFVLKLVERARVTLADFDHVLSYLHYLRHEHLFPEYEDVKDEILESDIVETIAGDLLDAAIEGAKRRGEMADDDDDDDQELGDGVPADEDMCTTAGTDDESLHDDTASPSPKVAGDIQEEEDKSTD